METSIGPITNYIPQGTVQSRDDVAETTITYIMNALNETTTLPKNLKIQDILRNLNELIESNSKNKAPEVKRDVQILTHIQKATLGKNPTGTPLSEVLDIFKKMLPETLNDTLKDLRFAFIKTKIENNPSFYDESLLYTLDRLQITTTLLPEKKFSSLIKNLHKEIRLLEKESSTASLADRDTLLEISNGIDPIQSYAFYCLACFFGLSLWVVTLSPLIHIIGTSSDVYRKDRRDLAPLALPIFLIGMTMAYLSTIALSCTRREPGFKFVNKHEESFKMYPEIADMTVGKIRDVFGEPKQSPDTVTASSSFNFSSQ